MDIGVDVSVDIRVEVGDNIGVNIELTYWLYLIDCNLLTVTYWL